jgi:hypothetical protein
MAARVVVGLVVTMEMVAEVLDILVVSPMVLPSRATNHFLLPLVIMR